MSPPTDTLSTRIPQPSLPTADKPDEDPRLFFEEKGEEVDPLVNEWVQNESQRCLDSLESHGLKQLQGELEEQLGRDDRLFPIERIGDQIYSLLTSKTSPRGVWKRTSLASYRAGNDKWEDVLDMNALNDQEPGNDWAWSGAKVSPNDQRAMISLSKGGSHTVEIREFDLKSRKFVESGFKVPASRGSVSWLTDDALIVTSTYGNGMSTNVGWERTARLWKRGQGLEEAKIVAECDPSHSYLKAWAVPAPEGIERIQVNDWKSRWNVRRSVIEIGSEPLALDVPGDATVSVRDDTALAHLRSGGQVVGQDFPAESVVAFSLSDLRQGHAEPQIIFKPNNDREAVKSCSLIGGHTIIHRLDDTRPVIQISIPHADGKGRVSWSHETIPGLPECGVADFEAFGDQKAGNAGTLLITTSDPLTPDTFSVWNPSTKQLSLLRQGPRTFNSKGLGVRRLHAPAEDGESIPYFVVGPEGDPEGHFSKDAYLNVKGYGGFARSDLLPGYDTATGVAWLAKGGTVISACIRGGGELGTRWHQAARGPDNKHKSASDWAAVVRHAHSMGISRPERTSAWGGSNGGLVVLNAGLKYPELFAGITASAPLTDMYRYRDSKLGGDLWTAEYGIPTDPEQWATMKEASPYHQDTVLKQGQRVPTIHIHAGKGDDIVHISHAWKMAHKLIATRGPETTFLFSGSDKNHAMNVDHFKESNSKAMRYLACGIPIGLFPEQNRSGGA